MNLSSITSSTINLTAQQPVVFPLVDFDQYNLSSSTSETEQLVNQLDQLFGYHKPLDASQEEQVNELFEDIDALLLISRGNGLSQTQQDKLDQLLNEVDEVYQARSYDSLNQREQQIAERLLEQLDNSLA